MKTLDNILITGICLLAIVPIGFYFFLTETANTIKGGEGMAILAYSFFYTIAHVVFGIVLFLIGLIGYYKHKQLKRKKSILLLVLISVLSCIPGLIIFL